MNFSGKDVNQVLSIIKRAEAEIKLKTGYDVELSIMTGIFKCDTPELLLTVICSALGIPMDLLRQKGRTQEHVSTRTVAAFFLKKYFPQLGSKKVGQLLGGYDHSSVLYMLAKAKDFYDLKDELFMRKHYLVECKMQEYITE